MAGLGTSSPLTLPARTLSPPSTSGPCTCQPSSGRPIFTTFTGLTQQFHRRICALRVGSCLCKMTASEGLSAISKGRKALGSNGTGSANHGALINWNVLNCQRGQAACASQRCRWRQQGCAKHETQLFVQDRLCVLESTERAPEQQEMLGGGAASERTPSTLLAIGLLAPSEYSTRSEKRHLLHQSLP